MVPERSLAVLHAIVSDYVALNEPVGSKSIVERHAFGVSAATIRNDMALLEDDELIAQTHTSSGRVPTDKGYRLYVDTLAKLRPMTAAQRSAIERFLGESSDLDDVMARTVRLLSQLTNQVAVVQYPSLRSVAVRHVDLVALGENRVLSVLILGNGVVEQQTAMLPAERASEVWLNTVRERIATRVVGQDIDAADRAVTELAATVRDWAEPGDVELAGSLPTVLEAIEEQVTLLRLFGELVQDERDIAASIGRENEAYGLSDASIIATNYEQAGASRLGVLGPLRMDYAGNIQAVRAVARYLNRLLSEDR
ncbi:heat-inducible transcription repressor HrcA [Leucobacter komagatae]|uniref:Heat-inducible transcription repressor HrcA n=1 Tax=Leucobacter komagatae TaxID=55969 RepID=A0A542Y3P8_9MICO|nr:heat-inducible transcriptional repressor HrcA [Leucobacter komagatae]TQL42693.1 heat-inducible transcription repressor HrcA [Leucobacter komagatae]